MKLSYEVFHHDVDALVDFYVDVLGFERPSDAASDHVVVTRDEVRVACCRDTSARPADRRPPAGSEIVLRVDDLMAEHDRAVATGWSLADPLQHRPWGMTDFRVFDPSGQYLRITGGTPQSSSGDPQV